MNKQADTNVHNAEFEKIVMEYLNNNKADPAVDKGVKKEIQNDPKSGLKYNDSSMQNFSNSFDKDMLYLSHIYQDSIKMLMPYVKQVVDSYDYEDSLIYENEVDRESIRQMSDRAYDKIKSQIDKNKLNFTKDMEERDFLHALVSLLVMVEIFALRRPKKRTTDVKQQLYYQNSTFYY